MSTARASALTAGRLSSVEWYRRTSDGHRMNQSQPPLAGLRVIESSILGPAAITTALADLGAEVVKVETPAGDYIRDYAEFLALAGAAS